MKEIPIVDIAKEFTRPKPILLCIQSGFSLICDANNSSAIEAMRDLHAVLDEESPVLLFMTDADLNRTFAHVPDLAWDLLDAAEDGLMLNLPNGKSVAAEMLEQDGSLTVLRPTNEGLCDLIVGYKGRIAYAPILTDEGALAMYHNEIPHAILAEVTTLLPLEPANAQMAFKKFPSVKLTANATVKIRRE